MAKNTGAKLLWLTIAVIAGGIAGWRLQDALSSHKQQPAAERVIDNADLLHLARRIDQLVVDYVRARDETADRLKLLTSRVIAIEDKLESLSQE